MSSLMDVSIDGAAQLRWTTSRQEQDKPHKVFFDTYLHDSKNAGIGGKTPE